MEVIKIVLGPIETNTYLVLNEDTLETVIIDPACVSDALVSAIDSEGLIPRAILLTHGHFDHVSGIDQLRDKYGIKVYVHKLDAAMITNAEQNLASFFGTTNSLRPPDETFEDGETVGVAGMCFKVIHTPGHTSGSVCFQTGSALFTGDTLFNMSIGATDFPGGDYETLKDSLSKLVEVVNTDYIVYPGHGASSSFFYERANNPYLRRKK